MIEQIRHLQSRAPFETFALELANGRAIQIHERHLVAKPLAALIMAKV